MVVVEVAAIAAEALVTWTQRWPSHRKQEAHQCRRLKLLPYSQRPGKEASGSRRAWEKLIRRSRRTHKASHEVPDSTLVWKCMEMTQKGKSKPLRVESWCRYTTVKVENWTSGCRCEVDSNSTAETLKNKLTLEPHPTGGRSELVV